MGLKGPLSLPRPPMGLNTCGQGNLCPRRAPWRFPPQAAFFRMGWEGAFCLPIFNGMQ